MRSYLFLRIQYSLLSVFSGIATPKYATCSMKCTHLFMKFHEMEPACRFYCMIIFKPQHVGGRGVGIACDTHSVYGM